MPICIKGARFDGSQATGPGYILFGEASPGEEQTSFAFETASHPISFVFGFTGVGCHYLCEILAAEKIVALYQFRDGIPIYLHHIRVEIPTASHIAILWNSGSIRIRLNGFTVINIVAEGTTRGHWGFNIPHGTRSLPTATAQSTASEPWEWICLGDGFSNNRWRNRDFLSWPELVFGGETRCLNACVGAGNSIRVAGVIEQIGTALTGARVIIAAGSDDLMEGSSFSDFAKRMEAIIATIRDRTERKITLATLPPRISDRTSTAEWSAQLRELADRLKTDVFDFYGWLAGNLSAYMVQGEYPGARAQEVIARNIASLMGRALPNPPEIPIYSANPQMTRIARKIERTLGRWTSDFPGLIR